HPAPGAYAPLEDQDTYSFRSSIKLECQRLLIRQQRHRLQLLQTPQPEKNTVPLAKIVEEAVRNIECKTSSLAGQINHAHPLTSDGSLTQADPPGLAASCVRLVRNLCRLRLQRRCRDHHAGGHGGIGKAVDQDKAAGIPVLPV